MVPNFQHTKDNHFKWGWGDTWYGPPTNKEQYKIHLGHTTRPHGSLREESVKAAEYIANQTNKPIIVGLSGGSDSQMTCLSLLQAKVPFSVIIAKYRYNDGKIVNMHDIEYAYEFCKKFNIKFQEFEINIDEFFKTKALELCKQYCMPKVGTIIQTQVMDFVGKDYCYIMAGGDPVMISMRSMPAEEHGLKVYMNHFSEPYWHESPVPIMQHMISNGYEGTSKFFLYTPELIASYLGDPIVQDFLRTFDVIMDSFISVTGGRERVWKCFHMLYKPIMTTREFPELIRTRKFTGYENLYAGALEVPGRMSVYRSMLTKTVKDMGIDQHIICTIENLYKYVTTPHSEQDVLWSTQAPEEL